MLVFILLKENLSSKKNRLFFELLENISPDFELLSNTAVIVDLGVFPDPQNVIKESKRIAKQLAAFQLGLGFAAGRFVAEVAARTAPLGTCAIVLPGEEELFLKDQAIFHLPIDLETLRRLELLGIHKIGQIVKLPKKDVVSLFGLEGSIMLSLARGIDESLVAGEKLTERCFTTTSFDFPVEGGDVVFNVIDQHVHQLCDQLKSKYKLVTCVNISLHLADHQPVIITVKLASPSDEAMRLKSILRHRLAALTLPAPITLIKTEYKGFVDSYSSQLTFDSLTPKVQRWRSVERILQRLAVRVDAGNLMQVVWTDPKSRIPERRGYFQDLVNRSLRRPLYPPKRIKVAANPKGIPHFIRVLSGWKEVERVVEAWELEDEWWTSRPVTRHYYRVLLNNGSILRLFRDQRKGMWYHQNR